MNLTIKSLTASIDTIMAYLTQRDPTVVLTSQLDFTKWKAQLSARCDAYRIWHKVNPESTLAFLEEPEPPAAPNVADYTPRRATVRPQSTADLSESGITALKQDIEYFKMRNENYKNQERKYLDEQKAIREITIFIQSTVSPHLQETCCKTGQSPREWIKSLTDTVGIDERIEHERARDRYLESLKPMRNAANWDLWLTDYDQAATQAEANGVAEVKDINSVTKDFVVAVWNVAPTWATSFQDTGRFTSGITRREMIKRFRDHMVMIKPQKTGRHKSAYAVSDDSAFHADDSESTQGNKKENFYKPGAPNPQRRGRPRDQRGRKETKRSSSDQEPSGKVGSSKCPACEMRHSLKECYYVHPDKAPEWFKPKPMLENYVRMKQEQDPEFQGLLRGQSKPRLNTPVTKNSHTPTPEVPDD